MTKLCLNCYANSGKLKYCSKRCGNTYNSRKLRQRRSKVEYLPTCLRCKCDIQPPRRMFCSAECKNIYNHKVKYNYKYASRHRQKSPENHISKLLEKKSREDIRYQKDKVMDIFYKQEGKCAISGVVMTHTGPGKIMTNISIDQINPAKGYTLENIQFVCYIVNLMKHTMTKEELISWCNKIIENNK